MPSLRRGLCAALLCFSALVFSAPGQQRQSPSQPPPEQDDEPVRVSTDLVQTDVMVFDKQGRRVEGLEGRQFELTVDGKPQEVSFFEYVAAGETVKSARPQAPAVKGAASASEATARRARPSRTIIFYLDDVHLSPESVSRARDLLNAFIDRDMRDGDQALVASASGQLGFLQQLIDDREVLRSAVARFKYRGFGLSDSDDPPMSMSQALAIERNDRGALMYFVEHIRAENPRMRRQDAEAMTKQRARNLAQQSKGLERSMLAAFESFVRSLSQLRGRKTVFFVSDGFVMDHRDGDVSDKLRRIADAAARGGIAVYTMDARGLLSGAVEASSKVRASRSEESDAVVFNSSDEVAASQEALRVLADATGGRALLNTNALESAVSRSLVETEAYYLLAWRPEQGGVERGGRPKFREIKVAVKGRPELVVQVNRGFFDAPPEQRPAATPSAQTTSAAVADSLRAAITATAPRETLPLSLRVAFTNDAAAGNVLTASVQLSGEAAEFNGADNGQPGTVDFACVVLDEEGKSAGGTKRQAPFPHAAGAGGRTPSIVTRFTVKVEPGLYQVRVAARHSSGGGRTGSVYRWVKVPKLKDGRLALSSLLLAERKVQGAQKDGGESSYGETVPEVDGRFERASRLLFRLYVYNAARTGTAAPDVTVQTDIFNGGRSVLNDLASPLTVASAADFARMEYAAEIPLAGLSPGTYTLRLTVNDRVARSTETRQLDFVVE